MECEMQKPCPLVPHTPALRPPREELGFSWPSHDSKNSTCGFPPRCSWRWQSQPSACPIPSLSPQRASRGLTEAFPGKTTLVLASLRTRLVPIPPPSQSPLPQHPVPTWRLHQRSVLVPGQGRTNTHEGSGRLGGQRQRRAARPPCKLGYPERSKGGGDRCLAHGAPSAMHRHTCTLPTHRGARCARKAPSLAGLCTQHNRAQATSHSNLHLPSFKSHREFYSWRKSDFVHQNRETAYEAHWDKWGDHRENCPHAAQKPGAPGQLGGTLELRC